MAATEVTSGIYNLNLNLNGNNSIKESPIQGPVDGLMSNGKFSEKGRSMFTPRSDEYDVDFL